MDRILKYNDCYDDSPSNDLKDEFEFKLNIDEYNLDDEKDLIPSNQDNDQILLNPIIWNSHNKDDNHNFHQKFNELVNKEKYKKFGSNDSITNNSNISPYLNATISTNDEEPGYKKAKSNKEISQLSYHFSPKNVYTNMMFQSNKNVKNAITSPVNNTNIAQKINLDLIMKRKERRTTIMIRNIPNKYTVGSLLEEINKDFKGKYDVLYLPLDKSNNCNLGFAFINFLESMYIIHFYDEFRGKKWQKFNSDKICELAYAKFQGKKELINHIDKNCMIKSENTVFIEDLSSTSPLPELPLKFFELFVKIYPYSKYNINKNTFTILSFYNF